MTYEIFYFWIDFCYEKTILSIIFIFYYIGMSEVAERNCLIAANSGDFYSSVKHSVNNFYKKNFSDNDKLTNNWPVLIVEKLCKPFTEEKEITDINSFFDGINNIFDDKVVKNTINNIKLGNSQEFESFSKVLVGLLNCLIDAEDKCWDAEDKCWTGLLGRQTWSWLIFWVFWDESLANEKKTDIAEPNNSNSKWIITPDYSGQIKTFYNNVKTYLINWLEKYDDKYFYLHQDWIRIFPNNILSKKITSADILFRVKIYLNNLGEKPQKISYTIWDDFGIKYRYWKEIRNSLDKDPAPFTEKENPELLYTNMFINELNKYTKRNGFIKELHQHLSHLNFDTIDKNTVDNFLTTFFGKLEEKLKSNSEEKDRNDIVFFYRVVNNFIKKEEVNVQNSSKIDATNLDNDGDGLDSRLDISKMDYPSYLYNSSILPTISRFVEDLGQTINNNFWADKLLELDFYRSLEDIFKSFEINSQKKYHDILGSNQELKKLDINTNTINEIICNIRNVKDYVDSINQSENMFNKEHTSILKSLMNWFADTYNQIINEIKRVDMETGITSGIWDWDKSFVDNTFLDDDELFKALEELHESIMTYVNKVVWDEHFKIESDFRNEKTQELNEISIPENREIIVMRAKNTIRDLLKKTRSSIYLKN